MRRASSNYYVIYDRKTEEVLASGYANECAEQLNMTMHSFYSMVSRVKRGTNVKYEVEITENDY